MSRQHTVPALKLKQICKTYTKSKVVANKDISVDIFPGEIFSVIGENGTGKSTLLGIISGEIPADSGYIYTSGREISFANPGEAQKAGIGMVHQHPRIVPQLSVIDNILLGGDATSGFRFIKRKAEKIVIENIFNVLGVEIDLLTPGSELTSSQEIWVCLAGLLYNKCSIILLDECTSTMTDDEIIHFFKILRKLAEQDKTIIFISHKLKEIITYSDRIAIMKSGTIASVYLPFETSSGELYNMLFPKADAVQPKHPEDEEKKDRAEPEEIIYSIQGGQYRERNTPLIKNLSFNVYKGETLAITGLRESGLEVIEDMVCGMVRLHRGKIEFGGRQLKNPDIRGMRQMGLSYIPTSRINRGSCLDAKLWENLIITARNEMHRKGLINEKKVLEETNQKIASFQIKASADSPLAHLSGGNIQKVIAARELIDDTRLVVFSEPSWGLDAHSRRMLYSKLEKIKRNGGAVVILSTDIEEVLSQSDHVLVMHNRQPFGEYRTADLDSQKLGRLMFGLKDGETGNE